VSDFDVLVVGSGFGGSVAALRATETTLSVPKSASCWSAWPHCWRVF